MADTTHNATGAAPTAAVLASQLPLGELAPSSDVDSERHAHLAATDSSVPASTNEDQPSTIDAVHRAPVASSPTSNSSLTASGGTPITSTLTDRVLASQTTRSAESMDEKVTSRMNEEKQEDIVDKQTGRGKDGKAKRKKGDKEKPKVDKRSPLEIAMEDPELANLSDEHRRVIAEQIQVVKRPPATFTQLFRYSTSFELVLNFIGLICAVAAGAAQPVMTIAFGNLTTAFTQYATISQVASSSPEAIAAARSHLYSEVNKDVLILVYIGIGSFVATFIYMGTWVYTGETTTRRIREKYLRAVLRQNVAFFDKMGPGEITTRIETDTHLIQEGISDKVPMSLFFLGAFFTGFIVAAIAGGAMNKFISDYKTRQLAATARGATLAEEVISSVRSAHAFGTQNKLADLYDEANQETENLGQKSARFNGLGLGVFFFIIYCSYALAFFYGTTLILQGRANAGQIVFFSILIGAFSLAMLAPNLQSMSSAQGAATEIFATIDREPVIDSASPAGLKPETVEGTIELTNVDFIYPSRPAVQVLYGFSGTFPHGKMTALVGGSGSGKSTIIGLMERFYDPVSGSITLDGVELRELNVKWLRNQIGLVSQEPTLFATTVAGNIEHGLIGSRFENESPEDRRRRVVEAAKQSNAHGFIEALPQGYDTQIGERGMLLSGGQKQRIAIARAIVSDPAILLLDEATSALDTASEAIVQDALDRASTGRTTICIAHRLSTIKDADQIIVLTAGHILESAMSNADGSAHELLLRNPDGPYSKLVNAQKFREDTEGPTSSSSSITDGDEKAPVPGELTRAQLDEMAANEKPQFETVKRIGTGRSAASEALERQQNDLEAGGSEGPVQHNFPYLLFRMFKLNGRETTPHYVLAFAAAVLTGCVYPVFGIGKSCSFPRVFLKIYTDLPLSIVFGGVLGVFSETDRDALRSGGNRYALYCFIIAIVATIGVIVQTWLFGATAERLAARLRLNTFKSILRQDIAYFDRDENSTGHLTATTSDLAQKILGLMGVTQGTIVAGVIRLKVVVLKDQKNKRSHEQSAQMACEAASAIRTVASLTREEDCSAIYSEYLDKPMQESNRVAIWSSALYAISQSLSFWVIGLIFWVVFGSIQAGNVFSFVPDMSNARGAAADFVRLVDSTPDIDAEDTSGNQFDLAASQGHIRFENCHFRYPTRPHVPVLRGLHLEVKPGQFAAIVGPSGCGKSTTIQLIERFYDPLAGHVIVDGQDISNLNVQSYRRAISLVSQEPTLYAGTIRFNITLGAHVPAEQVTQEEVERACKQANIHDFVMSLPDGYDTQVGGKGAQLSGGQKQRIAIARALVRDPKILLLDEATSALDSESEKVVQTALDQAAKNRTTIAIAHRLSSIQNADVIFVLKDGKVAERGTHFELLAKKGIYFELVAQQSLEKTQ
ncbi:SPOSA6832_00638 [Sporobolomyces salmonicolor]|uniref:SPOSA6832_00638-mRNA-1:cds n=1 Tax=Sporidiobolus salmonicolor TaxID=5005 RepID=A0A0D6EH83_SPOSA|nr:SPOSA6832_00638 [Sporobolomyces salmonicolor]